MGRELPLESLVRLDWSAPQHGEAGIAGHALHVDRFGNVITNLRIATWREQLQGEVSVQAGVVTLPLRAAKTYCEIPRGELGLIAGSQGFIEIAMYMGSASDLLSLAPGEPLLLKTTT